MQKTSQVANLRIVVEQVIRRLKTYRIFKYEIPIGLVSSVNEYNSIYLCKCLCYLKTVLLYGVLVDIDDIKAIELLVSL